MARLIQLELLTDFFNKIGQKLLLAEYLILSSARTKSAVFAKPRVSKRALHGDNPRP